MFTPLPLPSTANHLRPHFGFRKNGTWLSRQGAKMNGPTPQVTPRFSRASARASPASSSSPSSARRSTAGLRDVGRGPTKPRAVRLAGGRRKSGDLGRVGLGWVLPMGLDGPWLIQGRSGCNPKTALSQTEIANRGRLQNTEYHRTLFLK